MISNNNIADAQTYNFKVTPMPLNLEYWNDI